MGIPFNSIEINFKFLFCPFDRLWSKLSTNIFEWCDGRREAIGSFDWGMASRNGHQRNEFARTFIGRFLSHKLHNVTSREVNSFKIDSRMNHGCFIKHVRLYPSIRQSETFNFGRPMGISGETKRECSTNVGTCNCLRCHSNESAVGITCSRTIRPMGSTKNATWYFAKISRGCAAS